MAVAEAVATPVAMIVERAVAKVLAEVVVMAAALSVQLSLVRSGLVHNYSAHKLWARKYSVQGQLEHKRWECKLLARRK